jgi:hypothetical protein
MKYFSDNLASKEQDRKKTAIKESIESKEFSIQKRKIQHLNWVTRKVILGTGYTIPELKQLYSEESLFFVALKYVSTTKKSLCKALDLNIDNCCRYKRTLEKKGLLIESVENYVCRFSSCEAKILSTNPNKFEDLLRTNQLKFDF